MQYTSILPWYIYTEIFNNVAFCTHVRRSILAGLDSAYTGTVKIQSSQQKNVPLKDWVQKIQLISQYTRTALDPSKNIQQILQEPLKNFRLSAPENYDREIFTILEACNFSPDILTKKPKHLSGGQYQRVCIAQALLVKPEIIICDEITANLDKINELKILKLLRQTPKVTVIFISHDRSCPTL